MAMKCENCGKGIMYGHNVSHSKRRTRRIFKPNLHRARVVVGGISKRMKLCSKCLRKVKNQKSPLRQGSAGQAKVKSESKKLESEEIQQFNNAAIQRLATSD